MFFKSTIDTEINCFLGKARINENLRKMACFVPLSVAWGTLEKLSLHRRSSRLIPRTSQPRSPYSVTVPLSASALFRSISFLVFKSFVGLPALQKNFVNIFFVFAWEFWIEKWWGFLVNFFWSPSPTKRSTQNPRKLRRKFGAKFGAKIPKIRETFVLQLFWPKALRPEVTCRERFNAWNREALSILGPRIGSRNP